MRVGIAPRPRPDSRGEVPLYIRIQYTPIGSRGQTIYIALGIRVRLKDWNGRRAEVRPSYGPGADEMNVLLTERRKLARRIAQETIIEVGLTVTKDAVKEAVARALHPKAEAPPPAFLAFCRSESERAHARRGGVSTALAYESAFRNFHATLLAEGMKAEAVLVSNITGGLIRRHAERLAAPPPHGPGHAPNYVAKQLGVIRWGLGRAAEAGHPGAVEALAAARGVRVSREQAERNRLTLAQVREMATLPLSGRQADARDWFVFAVLAGGLRFSDLARLRWSQVKRDRDGQPVGIAFQQQKTGGRVSLPVVPEAASILRNWQDRTGPDVPDASEYVFGLLTPEEEADPKRLRGAVSRRGALARKMLRLICEAQGWPVVGTHGARHSLADHMRTSGASLYDVSKVLGHANTRVTEAYLKGFDEDTTAAALVRALSPPPADAQSGDPSGDPSVR